MRVTCGGLPISFESRGRGRTFFLLHGSPSDHARAMRQVEPAFYRRRGWRRIYPDLPGHGRTAGSSSIHDMDGYLEVLLDFVDRVSEDRPFCIGGISFGAYLALGIARKRSRRVKGLLLSAPEIHHRPEEERRDRSFGTPSIQTPRARAAGLPDYVEDTRWLQGLPWRDLSFDLYRGHRSVRAPALFLFGRDDAPFRAENYWRMLPQFPQATFAVLGSAGHRVWADRNELACDLTRDWLDRVEAAWAPDRSGAAKGAHPGS